MQQTQVPFQPAVTVLMDDAAGLKPEARSVEVGAIQLAVEKAGAQLLLVPSAQLLIEAVDARFPALILIRLPASGDWLGAIRRCKMRPHSKAIPLHVFCDVLDEGLAQDVLNAGADRLWFTVPLAEAIDALVERSVHPPILYLEGWNEQLPILAWRGIEEFNRGQYFEQHETLEEAWMAEERPIRQLYQGILQIGVALLQIEEQNWVGAVKMMRRGLPKLRNLPPVCQGIELATLRRAAEEIHLALMQMAPEQIASFDRRLFPKIRLVDPGDLS